MSAQFQDVWSEIGGKNTVFTTAGCPQCGALKRKLDKHEVAYTEYRLDDDANKRFYDFVTTELGFSQAPVMLTYQGDYFYGFNPLKVSQLIDSYDNDEATLLANVAQ